MDSWERTGSRGTAPWESTAMASEGLKRDGVWGRALRCWVGGLQPHTRGGGTQRKMAQSWSGAGLLSPELPPPHLDAG